MRKVFIEGNDHLLISMFQTEGYEVVHSLLGADLLCVEGGADVTPELYGEANEGLSGNDENKDVVTFGLMAMAEIMGVPIVGICRGSQALCVHEGGKLNQHINGHGRSHNVVYGDRIIPVSSTHHQEAQPLSTYMKADVLNVWYAEDGVVEVTEYGSNNLGCQFHPEYFSKGHPCWDFFFELVDKVCFDLDIYDGEKHGYN